MNFIIEFNIIHPICQTASVFSVEMQLLKYDRLAALSEDVLGVP